MQNADRSAAGRTRRLKGAVAVQMNEHDLLAPATQYSSRGGGSRTAVAIGAAGCCIEDTPVTPVVPAPTITQVVPGDGFLDVYFDTTRSLTYWTVSTASPDISGNILDISGNTSPIHVSGLINGIVYTVRLTKTVDNVTSAPSSPVTVTAGIPPSLYFDPGNTTSYPLSNDIVRSIGTSTVSGIPQNISRVMDTTAGNVFFFPGNTTSTIKFSSFNFGNTFTVLGWVSPNSTPGGSTLISNNSTDSYTTSGFTIGWNLQSSGGRLGVIGNNNTLDNSSNFTITYSVWQQVGYTIDNINKKVIYYKNGSKSGSDSAIYTEFTTNNTEFNIGSAVNMMKSMQGYIGELLVYPAVLTGDYINRIFNSQKARYGL